MADRDSIAENVLSLIGNTPMVYLNNVTQGCKGKVAIKLEYFNPACSIKDRIAYSMIIEAEKVGKIKPGVSTLIEITSGNTGIAMAYIAAVRGYKTVIIMPAAMSLERRMILRAFGAELILIDSSEGLAGLFQRAKDLAANIPNSFLLNQLENPDNPKIHYETTGPEIWRQTKGEVDAVVFGVGTGGTLTGVGKYLREKKPSVKIFAVEPKEAAILNGENFCPHKIQGIGSGLIPAILDTNLFEKAIKIHSDEALIMARRLALEEGILAGISSGANVCAAIHVANMPEMEGKLVVTTCNSFGERYLSTSLFDSIREETMNMKSETFEENLKRLKLYEFPENDL